MHPSSRIPGLENVAVCIDDDQVSYLKKLKDGPGCVRRLQYLRKQFEEVFVCLSADPKDVRVLAQFTQRVQHIGDMETTSDRVLDIIRIILQSKPIEPSSADDAED